MLADSNSKAGLFSAVVTAFIVESYKGLQRNPDDDIVNILSQIAVQLGNPLNTTSFIPSKESPLLQAFAPGASTIRVNTVWFMSLVLSLTTVLVGIVSLQWLREHQNYTSMTPRQQYAIFHMRAEGLEKWQVHRIFTAMPLLLQSALVLFFTGIIDFLLAFGHIAVVIPVTIVIGFTLLFLVATTLLPTLQGFTLFFNISFSGRDRNLPAQCPFKSPQSDAVRAISLPMFILLRLLHPHIRTVSQKVGKRLSRARSFALFDWMYELYRRMRRFPTTIHRWLNRKISPDKLRSGPHYTFFEHVIYYDRTWLSFDLNWLAIRDSYMRCAFRRPLERFDRLGQDRLYNGLPLWDILQGLISQVHPDVSLAYHALEEVCDDEFSNSDDYQKGYLYDIVATGTSRPGACFPDFYKRFYDHPDSKSVVKYQILFMFLHRIPSLDRGTVSLHMAELQLRLIRYVYMSRCLVREHSGGLPLCLIPKGDLFSRRIPLVCRCQPCNTS